VIPERIGKYLIERRLGSGGMGSLYLARHPSLDNLVAIKILKDDFQDDPELRERFVREARSAARLKHDNIVVVHDFVADENQQPFIVMEYIEGDTLAKRLREQPPLPLDRRLALLEDLCSGLAHAHAKGVVHRDIKPANLMLDKLGILKILDFGIARLGNSGMTQEGMMMGSVNYMSPEQIAGRGVDHRTDIFAAGAVMYEVLTLEQAFPGGIDSGVLNRILNDGPTPLQTKVPNIDPELTTVVDAALKRDVEQRFQRADDMRRAIARIRRRLQSGEAPTVISGREEFSSVDPARIAALKHQQLLEYLTKGNEALVLADFDKAQQFAERAIAVDSAHRPALELYDRARFGLEAGKVRSHIAQTLAFLDEGRIAEAEAAVTQASITLPNVPGATELRASVRDARAKVEAAREREHRITASLDRARSSLDAGALDTALRAVYEVLSLDPDRLEARDLEQQAKARLQAKRDLDRAERSAREGIRQARGLADEGLYDAADAVLSAIEAPSETTRSELTTAQADIRRARHLAAVAAIVDRARDLMRREQFEEVQAVLTGLEPEDLTAEASALQASAAKALQARQQLERARRELEDGVAAVQGLIENKNLAGALERLDVVSRLGLKDDRIQALRTRISELAALEHERQQREARDRHAERRVEAARQLVKEGRPRDALALLERDELDHPLVQQAQAEIRRLVAEQDARAREIEEARRREELEQQRIEAERVRQAEIEQERQEAERAAREREAQQRRAADEARRQEEALVALLAHVAALTDHEEALRRLENAPRDARVDAEREARTGALERQRAEARRREEEQARARQAERERQEAERAARKREEQQRRAAEEARQQEEALVALLASVAALTDHEEALRRLEDAPRDPRVDAAREARTEALERQRAEARRREEEQARARQAERERQEREERRLQEEAERLRAEEQRRQEEAVTLVVTRVRALDDHQAALAELRELETIVPNNSQVRTLIRLREDALAAQAAREAAEREKLAQKARDQRAQEVEDQARRLSAAGQHHEALEVLRRADRHPRLDSALVSLEARHREIEREHKRQARIARRAVAAARLRRLAGDRRVRLGGLGLAIAAVLVLGWTIRPPAEPIDVASNTGAGPAPDDQPSRPTPPEEAPNVAPSEAPVPPVVPDGRITGGAVPGTNTGTTTGTTAPARGSGPTGPAPGTSPGARAASPAVPIEQPTRGGGEAPSPPQPQNQAPAQPAPIPAPPVSPPPVAVPAPEIAVPAPTPRVSVEAERAAIRRVLAEYVEAYQSLDDRRIRSIDPTFGGFDPRTRALLRAVQVTLSSPQIDVDADGLSARVLVTQTVVNRWERAGLPTNPPPVSKRWNFRKVGTDWRIVP